ALLPAVEPHAARKRIDASLEQPGSAAVLTVLAPVVEHVVERVPDLPDRVDRFDVIAVGEHLTATPLPAHPRTLSVEMLGRRDLEALHAARERELVACLA